MGGERVSGSRFGRLGRLGWLGRHALPLVWRRLRESRDEPPAALAAELLERHADAAEEMFATLGSMKGLALKAGQMISYLDGALPESYRPVYQAVLTRLQAAAPALPWSAVEPVLVAELGAPVAARFAEFSPEPFAAASIGQVHRARLPDGREVAVKVQYPGIEKAIEADLKNAAFLKSFKSLFLIGKQTLRRSIDDIFEEIRARTVEELDYRREARMQERFRGLVADDVEIWIPRIVPACSSGRVLTSEFVAGRNFDEICREAPQAARDRYAAILTRFMLRSVYEFRLFNADPHPGNYLFPADGRVALLDFGCVKELPGWLADASRRYLGAAVRAVRTDEESDWAAFDAAIADAFQLDRDRPDTFALYREFVLYCLRPYLRDEWFQFTPEYAGGSIDLMLNGMKKMMFAHRIPRIPDLPSVPADFTFLSRLQWGFYSVLTRLRAGGNWHRMLPADMRAQ
jgi:predicted unusual protein kinase regulating ubiquinone biosynthesis (AarF/ABC1/UbiB family)